MTHNIKNLAGALILMGALVACGEDVTNVEYSIDDNDTPVRTPTLSHREKCYGIALAQHNDCASRSGQNCAGTSNFDYQTDVWKFAPRGTCEEKGGSLQSKPDDRAR